MRDELARLFDAKHRLGPDAATVLTEDDINELVAMIRGEERARDLARAMDLVTRVRPEAVLEPLEAIASDVHRPGPERILAVRYLTRVGGPRVEERLRALTQDDDSTVRIAALRELAATGSAVALQDVGRLTRSPQEPARRMAVLAAALIAFRHGTEGWEPQLPPPIPSDRVRWEVPIDLHDSPSSLAEHVVREIAEETFGLRPQVRDAKTLECGRQRFVLLLDEGMADGGVIRIPSPPGRLAGVVAKKAEVDDSYSTALLILTWHARPGAQELGIFRTDGMPVAGGAWGAGGEFLLEGVEGGGSFMVHIGGNTRPSLRFETAQAGRSTVGKRTPKPTGPPT